MYNIHNIKKSLISAAIVASIALSSASTVSLANNTYNNVTFTDVKSTDWFHDSVVESARMGLITGKGGGAFDPKGNLTLAEAISLASRVRSNFEGTEISVSEGEWYQGSVNYAKQKKIIGNNYEGRYNQPATRSEMAQIFASSLPASHFTQLKPVVNIPDVGTKDTNYIYIQQLYRAGIVNGNLNGHYNPASNITRAETASILQRVFDANTRNRDQVVTKPVVKPQAPVVKPQAPVVTPERVPGVKPPVTSGGATVYVSGFRGSIQTVSSNPSPNLNKIVTRYGRHTYGAQNQNEYDFIMGTLDAAYDQQNGVVGSTKERIQRYKNGERDVRLNNFMKNNMFYTELKPETFDRVMHAELVMSAINKGGGGNTKDLYTNLTKGTGDCTALAYKYSAAFDRLGFNTRMVHTKTHGWTEVEIDGKWYSFDGALSPNGKAYDGILVGETFGR